jgi:hypothetical protein
MTVSTVKCPCQLRVTTSKTEPTKAVRNAQKDGAPVKAHAFERFPKTPLPKN